MKSETKPSAQTVRGTARQPEREWLTANRSLAATRHSVYGGSIAPKEEFSMKNRTSRWYGLVAALVLLGGGAAFAAGDPSPEMRQQMAAVHQKMADCLKSARPIAECRTEMMSSCRAMMGGGMMHGPGKMQGGTTQEEPPK